MRGRPSRYNVHRPDEPDQNRCEERAQFSSTAPGRNPPPLASFVSRLGRPGVCATLLRSCAQIALYTVVEKPAFDAND